MHKRYQSVSLVFIIAIIDNRGRSFHSSSGTTPKFILPLPFSDSRGQSHPHLHLLMSLGVLLSDIKTINVWAQGSESGLG